MPVSAEKTETRDGKLTKKQIKPQGSSLICSKGVLGLEINFFGYQGG